ncbi:MAG TPA: septal ring lytic transglycosylase RlpA family protein [Edaphobacter sp.]
MEIIPAKLRDVSVSPRRGVAIVTLLLALGVSASASDPGAADKNPVTNSQQSGKGRHWYQIGQASWYGTPFQGKKTANGEKYDMNALTCAHRSLPLGSWIRVTNLTNRKSVFVRVNDRGPVLGSRIIDLSYGAARAVGIKGLAKVKLETLQPGDPEMAKQLIAQLQVPVSVERGL